MSMEAIQLTILALLANGPRGLTQSTTGPSTTESNTTVLTASSVQDSNTPMASTFWTTTYMPNISGLPNDLPNTTTNLMNMSSTTSQTTLKFSSEPSTSGSTSQPTSPGITIMTTAPVMTRSTMSKQTNKNQGGKLNASMIIACVIGGLLLLLVISIISILLGKRCSRANTVQDLSWAGTCPGPTGEDPEHIVEGCDVSAAPGKRSSLTTFLSRKSKRDSLLDQYSMDVQEAEGINNCASTETEEKILPAEVNADNETAKEPLALTKTQVQEFPPLLEAHAPQNEDGQQAPPAVTDTETSRLSQGVPDADSNNAEFLPPPMDILDLVNDSDLPPPL